MPLYAHACDACEHRFDQRLGFDSATVVPCPRCGGVANRQITLPMTVVYKGKGWRTTEYDIGRDYFGLQAELREVAERKERMKGSRDDVAQREERADHEHDAAVRRSLDSREAVERVLDTGDPGPNGFPGPVPHPPHGHPGHC